MTTLEYRHNGGYGSILSVTDGAAVRWTYVTGSAYREFAAGGFDASDWDGASPDYAAPDAYGSLVAVRSGTQLDIVDPIHWAEQAAFLAVNEDGRLPFDDLNRIAQTNPEDARLLLPHGRRIVANRNKRRRVL